MKSREQISSLLTLKKVLEGYDSENASSAMAKNVLKPPFHTAGPISRKVARARSKKTSSHQTSRWNIFYGVSDIRDSFLCPYEKLI